MTPLQNFRLRVAFVDATVGEVDLRRFFEPLERGWDRLCEASRPGVFSQARVELGAVQWPNVRSLLRMRCMMPFVHMVSGLSSSPQESALFGYPKERPSYKALRGVSPVRLAVDQFNPAT